MRKLLHQLFGWHYWERITYRREIQGGVRYMTGRRCRVCAVIQSQFFGRRYWITVPEWQITHES